MAQQLPTDYPIDPTVTSGTALADILNRSDEVFNSTNSGPTRPTTIKTGGLWAKTGGVALELFMFDGTTDIPIQSGDFGVSTDAGNMTVLGTDGLVYTPLVETGVSTDAGNITTLGTDGLVFTAPIPQATETLAGLVELATAAESQAWTDAVRAITPKTLADAFGGGNVLTNSSAGFQKLPGGLIIQWANGLFPAIGGGSILLNFPIAFPSKFLIGLSANNIGAGAGGTTAFPVTSTTGATQTQITVQNLTTAPSGSYFSIIVIGI